MNASGPRPTLADRRDASAPPAPRGADPLLPRAQGLYDPANEHDSCGVGFVADMKNRKSHAILEKGLQILVNLDHRGATGADATLGDGCGVLTQIPHGFFAEECAKLGIDPARARPLRDRPVLHAARRPRRAPGRARSSRRRSPPRARSCIGWRDVPVDNSSLGERVKAVEPVHRQVFIGAAAERRRRGRVRAQAVHPAQGDLQPRLCGRRRRHRGILSRLDVLPHHRLQGHGAGPAARALLQGSARPALRDRARAGASALRDQHLPVLAARPSLSHGRPQRRDQHAARQRQLDGGAPGERRFRIVRQRHLEAVADLLRGPVGHRLFRQRARIPGARRLFADPCDDDADPRGLGRQSADGRGAARLLRISRRADGAVGRPGRDGVHRRAPDRRDARPQRPAAGALFRHRRRPRRARLGNGRAARARGDDRRQVAPAAGQDAAGRPRAAPHRLRRRDQADAVARPSLSANGWRRRRSCSRTSTRSSRAPRAPTSRCSIASRPSATRRRISRSCWRRWRPPARKRSARWAPTRRSRRSPTSRSCSTPISSRTSRR